MLHCQFCRPFSVRLPIWLAPHHRLSLNWANLARFVRSLASEESRGILCFSTASCKQDKTCSLVCIYNSNCTLSLSIATFCFESSNFVNLFAQQRQDTELQLCPSRGLQHNNCLDSMQCINLTSVQHLSSIARANIRRRLVLACWTMDE